ncbi:MAG: hypothetical protein WD533_02490 [Dehalococcoidia bacterium]
MFKSHVSLGSFLQRSSLIWLAFGILAGLALATITFGPSARADEHGNANITLASTEVNFSEADGVAWIYGSNLTPGQEVGILLRDGGGVYTDISSASIPYPAVVGDDGAFAVRWDVGRFARVGGEGLYTLRIVDRGFNEIGTAPIALCNHARGEGEDAPEFCSQ